MKETRRNFLKNSALCGTVFFAGSSLNISLANNHVVSESDPQAKALGYVSVSSKDGQACSNCALFQPEKDEIGGCPLFGGKKVASQGWCTAWAKK